MLSEEVLFFLVGLGACGLLILGTLEIVSPSRWRRANTGPRPRAERPRWTEGANGGEGADRAPQRQAPPRPRPAAPPTDGSARPAPPASDAPVPPTPPAEPAPARAPVLDRCFALFGEQRFAEALGMAEAALGDTATPAPEQAGLWSLAGLARHALGDAAGAASAFDAAIQLAAPADRPTYARHLATLAAGFAERLLATAERQARVGSDEEVRTLGAAIEWIERGLAAVPDDPALLAAGDRARQARWVACERLATALVRRGQHAAARAHLEQMLGDPAMPDSRAQRLRELLAASFNGEIGQLTARAIRELQQTGSQEALAALRRAAELLAAIPEGTLTPARRQEVDRRLWWGYVTLGARRLEAGDFEGAIEALGQALALSGVGEERAAEARRLLLEALDGAASEAARAARALSDRGERDKALAEGERASALLRRALALGLSRDDLEGPMRRVERVFEEV